MGMDVARRCGADILDKRPVRRWIACATRWASC
jgi:hypothetical protein